MHTRRFPNNFVVLLYWKLTEFPFSQKSTRYILQDSGCRNINRFLSCCRRDFLFILFSAWSHHHATFLSIILFPKQANFIPLYRKFPNPNLFISCSLHLFTLFCYHTTSQVRIKTQTSFLPNYAFSIPCSREGKYSVRNLCISPVRCWTSFRAHRRTELRLRQKRHKKASHRILSLGLTFRATHNSCHTSHITISSSLKKLQAQPSQLFPTFCYTKIEKQLAPLDHFICLQGKGYYRKNSN